MDISNLEKKYQLTARSASVSEKFEMHRQYLSYLEEQFANDSKNIHALIHLGVLSWEPFHQNEKAIEYLMKAITLDPQNTEARFWLATCYYHDFCAYEKSRKFLLEALQIDPNRAECLSLLACVVMDTSKDTNAAIEHLKKAIQIAPDWPMLRLLISEFYLKSCDVQHAQFHIDEAFKHQPLTAPPKNFVEDYYEKIITGRSWINLEEKFEPLISEILNLKRK